MGWTVVPIIIGLALVSGAIHTVTGFGAGIIMMLFFPLFLPILQASALSTLITLYLTITLAIQLRHHADKRLIPLPLLVFFVFSACGVQAATMLDTRILSIVFGLFLIALSVYFTLVAKSIRLTPNWKSGSVCAALSGTASGMFGLSGPPMAVYFLAALGDDKVRYLATSQLFFCFSSLYTTGVRVAHGIITPELIPLALCGMLGMIFGKRIGLAVLKRIDAEVMKRIIYIFLGVSGLVMLLRNLF